MKTQVHTDPTENWQNKLFSLGIGLWRVMLMTTVRDSQVDKRIQQTRNMSTPQRSRFQTGKGEGGNKCKTEIDNKLKDI